jgi:hypothetical protein
MKRPAGNSRRQAGWTSGRVAEIAGIAEIPISRIRVALSLITAAGMVWTGFKRFLQ